MSDKDSRLVFETFGDLNLSYLGGKLILQPQTEGGNIFLRQGVGTTGLSGRVILFNPDVLADILIRCSLNVGEPVTLVLTQLREADLVNVISEHKYWWRICTSTTERLHEWVGEGLLSSLSGNEVDLILALLHLLYVVV